MFGGVVGSPFVGLSEAKSDGAVSRMTVATSPFHQQCRSYTTNAMYLAAWLIIDQKLKYVGAKINPGNGQGVFVFDDPEGLAPELEREFLTGDPAVSIRRIKDTLQMLRDHLRRAGGR